MTTRRWQLAHGRHLDLGGKAVVVGILNVTPDSFSDGGLFDAPDSGAGTGAPHGGGRGVRSSMSVANRPGPARRR